MTGRVTGDGAAISGRIFADGQVIPAAGGAASQTREVFFTATDYNANMGDFRTRSIGSTAVFRFTFAIPFDVATITELTIIGIPNASFASAPIELFSNYGAIGEDFDTNAESDIGSTYSATIDQLFEIDLTPVFSSASAGDYCGLQVDHDGLGTSVEYVGVRLRYTT